MPARNGSLPDRARITKGYVGCLSCSDKWWSRLHHRLLFGAEKMALQGMMFPTYITGGAHGIKDADLSKLAGNSFNVVCVTALAVASLVAVPWSFRD